VRPIPPGPAFIPWHIGCAFIAWYDVGQSATVVGGRPIVGGRYVVPPDYIWSPGTDSTMAGWVRPKGGAMP
jgi:hypothetical protein